LTWTVDVKKLFAGRRQIVYHVVGVADAGAAALTEFEITDVDSETYGGDPATHFTVDEIKYSTLGVQVDLEFEAGVNDELAILPADEAGCLNFRETGGNTDPLSPGFNGNVIISTASVADANFDITLYTRPKGGAVRGSAESPEFIIGVAGITLSTSVPQVNRMVFPPSATVVLTPYAPERSFHIDFGAAATAALTTGIPTAVTS